MNVMIIYKIENVISGKMYIGQSVRTLHQRIQSYKDEVRALNRGRKSANRPIINSISKYGIENFRFLIIDKARTQYELDVKEKFWISIYSSNIRGIGYNIDISRGGVGRRSDVSKKKTSDAQLGHKNSFYGRTHSPDTIQQMSDAHKNKTILETTRTKISVALSGEKSGNAKLNNQQIIQLKEDRKSGLTLKQLSNKYNLAISNISNIVSNKTYR